MTEIDKIVERYERRVQSGRDARYTPLNSHYMYEMLKLEFKIAKLVASTGLLAPNRPTRVVEFGCGKGEILFLLRRLGFDPRFCFGVDLVREFLQMAAQKYPEFQYINADVSHAPIAGGTFDLALQVTVFSSIHDTGFRYRVASEMIRLLRKGGFLIWYDFIYPNPFNKDVRRVTPGQRKDYFGEAVRWLKTERVTFLPPVAGILARHAVPILPLLESLRVFNTHELCLAQKV